MDKSWKNLVQEYCQKNGLALPVYSYPIRIDMNRDNEPVWQSVLTIFDGTQFKGNASDKKTAEMNCAKDACEYIALKYKQTEQKSVKEINYNQKVTDIYGIQYIGFNKILLVDGENCDFDIKKLPANTLVIIFAAKNTTKKKIFEYQENYLDCYVFLSECVGKDAADHLLTFTAGQLSVMHGSKQFYVLTRDHYGEYLGKFMKNCKFICSINEMNQDNG